MRSKPTEKNLSYYVNIIGYCSTDYEILSGFGKVFPGRFVYADYQTCIHREAER
jgi:hypothetical protein